jgi:hypothetical protein
VSLTEEGEMRMLRKIGGRSALAAAVLVLISVAAPTAATATNGAFVTHENLSGTATFPVDNPCNGETFLATSTFQFVTTITQTPGGNDTKAELGVFHGTGVTDTGVRYVFETVGTDVISVVGGGTLEVFALLNPTIHFIRIGEDGTREDFFFHVVLIAHIDLVTETVTLQLDHSSTECR